MNVEKYRAREARLRINEQREKQEQNKQKEFKQALKKKSVIRTPLMPKALVKTTETSDENSALI